MRFVRYLVPTLAALAVLGATPGAQGPAIPDKNLVYILPQYGGFISGSDADFAQHLARLKALGESPRVRTGFTAYVAIRMADWTVDVTDSSALRASMAGTIADIDAAIARAKINSIPIAISFLMPIRAGMDAVQAASQAEDVRNMQWHADNSVATGWWTHSQYARKQRVVMEAHLRELGRVVANRMAADPGTLVAVTGDAEVEMSTEKQVEELYADYSPFAIAEFRDWLTARGLYAPGQALGQEAYELAARYTSDRAPNQDAGDGHSLVGDFPGLGGMSSWNLRHFDWSLSDDFLTSDPGAISEAVRNAGAFSPTPDTIPDGFDAPRVFDKSDAWWRLWHLFRQQVIWRYNRDFAKWMTTSADPLTGTTVPSHRFYSDQIPADFLFGFTGENANPRFWESASAWWTADISPYGSIGITSFNSKYPYGDETRWARTLAAVGPEIAATGKRWGIIEWNPSLPATTDPAIYRSENELIVRYRPSLLIPFNLDYPGVEVWGTGFEVALPELIQQLGTVPLSVSPAAVNTASVAGTSQRTAPQIIRVSGAAGERTPSWTITAVSSMFDVQIVDSTSFSVAPLDLGLPPGNYSGTVTVSSSDPSYSPATLTVNLKVADPAQTVPPTGTLDTPAQDAVVTGEVAVTGWATDDVGVAAVDIFVESGGGLAFVGTASFVEGARNDIQALNPEAPQKGRAGWGYMLLSNFLPNGGNGTYTLHAIARDQDGKTTTLGTRRITGDNGRASLPFGTIDTPRQGEAVSGVITNWGWALTPGTAQIPIDGSTIGVYIDGVFVGRPVYGLARADIQALFPGYTNTDTAVGNYQLDTTTLANGVHTIAWVVTDSQGRAQGIGSRFFTVANP